MVNKGKKKKERKIRENGVSLKEKEIIGAKDALQAHGYKMF